MPIVIIPGIHSPELTDRFVEGIQDKIDRDYLILPTEVCLPYDAIAVYRWLEGQPLDKKPLSFIAFSAGVVGAIGAAIAWQLQGGKVHGFIAFDGWGMPLIANFPIYRVSHDYFTHWSSGILGTRTENFYAEPAIEHLELWRSPKLCQGWRTIGLGWKTRDTLTNYLANVLNS